MKDISKVINQFVSHYLSYRDDITLYVNSKRMPKDKDNPEGHLVYRVVIHVTLKPTDGLYAKINKNIDRVDLMRALNENFNLYWDNCMIEYHLIDPWQSLLDQKSFM